MAMVPRKPRSARYSQSRKSALCLISLVVLSGCGGGGGSGSASSTSVTPTDPATVVFNPHLQPFDQIAMVYPDGWMRTDQTGDPSLLMQFLEPEQSSTDQFLENVVLVRVDSMADLTGNDVTNVREVSSRSVQIAGFDGQEDIFDADVAGVPLNLRFMQLAFEFGDDIYGLLYAGERAEFDRNIDIVRFMASQMTVGQALIGDLNRNSDLSSPGRPAVATDGSRFLVVSCREADSFPFDTDLVGRIIEADRSVGDEFLIKADVDTGNTDCEFTNYKALFDGVNFVVTYMTGADPIFRAVVAQRISPAGQVIDVDPILVGGDVNSASFSPDAAFDGSRTLVVWHRAGVTDAVVGAFLLPDGTVTPSFVIESDLDATFPNPNNFSFITQVAYSDEQFMVAWSPYFFRDTRSSDRSIFGQLLDLSGNTLLPQPITVRADNGDNPRYWSIASDGSSYVVGWIEGLLETNIIDAGTHTAYARRFSNTGARLDSGGDPGVVIAPPLPGDNLSSGEDANKSFLDVSFVNGDYWFAWATIAGSIEGLYGARASADLSSVSSAGALVGISADTFRNDLPRPSQPIITPSTGQALVAWPTRNGEVEGWFLDDSVFSP